MYRRVSFSSYEAFFQFFRFQSRENTVKRTWEGVPLGRRRNVFNHSSLALPSSSMSYQLSAPQMIDAMAINNILPHYVREYGQRGLLNPKNNSGDFLYAFWTKENAFIPKLQINLDASALYVLANGFSSTMQT
jgi:hypothetical protein